MVAAVAELAVPVLQLAGMPPAASHCRHAALLARL
jgi:hypothetical protein